MSFSPYNRLTSTIFETAFGNLGRPPELMFSIDQGMPLHKQAVSSVAVVLPDKTEYYATQKLVG